LNQCQQECSACVKPLVGPGAAGVPARIPGIRENFINLLLKFPVCILYT